MKKLSKILSILVVVSMLLSTVAFAAEFSDVKNTVSYYEPVSILSAFGIINGYEDGTFGPDKDVTRAEFSAMLMRAMASSGVGSSDPASTPFTDLGDAAWAVSDIKTAYDLGIINGMTETTFEPNNKVTYEQALKMIVCALNYGAQSEEIQNSMAGQAWYYGYLQTAYQIKLTDGVNVVPGQPAKRWEIAQMIYNALEIPMLEKLEVTGGGAMYQQTTDTFLNSKLNITKARGEVYADETNTMHPDGDVARAGYTLLYNNSTKKVQNIAKGDVKLDNLLGKTVDYYYKTDAMGNMTLVLVISKTGNTSTVEIDSDFIDKITGDAVSGFTISYYQSVTSTSASQITTSANPVVSVNGRVITNPTRNDLRPESGKLEIIATDGINSKINIEAYETYVVQSVNTTDKYIVDLYKKSDGVTNDKVVLDENDGNVVLTMKNASGSDVALRSLAQYNVLSVREGQGVAGRKIMDVTVSTKTVTGNIMEIDIGSDIIKVNSTEYEISSYLSNNAPSSLLNSFSAGDTCKLYLDKNDKIAYIEKTTSASTYYGYIAKAGVDNNDELKVALISSKTPSMGSPTLTCADRVKIDGEVLSSNDAILAKLALGAATQYNNIYGTAGQYSQLVKYTLNSAGKISAIETAYDDATNENLADETTFKGFAVTRNSTTDGEGNTLPVMTYKSSSKDFVGQGNSKFRISSSTQVFVVPEDRNDYEQYGRKSQSYFKDSRKYVVEPFDVTGSLNVAGAVVVYPTSATETKIDGGTPIFIITSINQTMNDSGVECDMVKGYEINISGNVTEEKTFYTESLGVISNNYAVGDVIRYVTNNSGYVVAGTDLLENVLDADSFAARYTDKTNSGGTHVFTHSGLLVGSALDGSSQMFDLARTTNVAECDGTATIDSFNAGSSVKYFTYETTSAGTPKVTMQEGMLDFTSFPSYNETVSTGTLDATKVFVYKYGTAVRAIYVIK